MTAEENDSLSVAEAAAASGVSDHALRYYERAGLLDPVLRDAAGRRRYRARDLEAISFIARLRATGMPIRRIRQYADAVRAGTGGQVGLALLEEHRDVIERQLAELRANLEAVERKVATYQRQHEQESA